MYKLYWPPQELPTTWYKYRSAVSSMSTADSEWMAMTVTLDCTVTRPWFVPSPGRFPYLTGQLRQGTSFSWQNNGKNGTLELTG